MITPFETYLILKLTAIGVFFIVAGVSVLILLLLSCVVLYANSNSFLPCHSYESKQTKDKEMAEEMSRISKNFRKVIYVFLFSTGLILIGMLFPTTKEGVMIYLVPKIANNQNINQIPNKLADVVNKYMDSLAKGEA